MGLILTAFTSLKKLGTVNERWVKTETTKGLYLVISESRL